MLKYFLHILFCLSMLTAVSQDFLNGDFEINTAGGDQINLDNNTFNGFMSNTIAYGSFGNMDIVTSTTYCGGPAIGNWYLCLTGGETDAITMQLTSPLSAGQTYNITFWDRACNGFSSGPMPVRIGVTNTPGTTGTIVYTAPISIESQWTQRSFSFVAPSNDLYISVSLEDNPLGSNTSMWAHIDDFQFSTPACPLALNLGNDQSICTGQNLVLDATLPGATYVWQDGSTSPTFNVVTGGTYSVTATVGTCDYTDSITITEIPPIDIELGTPITLCPGESHIFDVTTANATYLWQNGSTQPIYVSNTTEQISVTVSIGQCSDSDNTNVTILDFPPIDLGQDISVCSGISITLDPGNSGYTYEWQDGSTSQTFSPTTSGNYSVQYSNGICNSSDQINVTFNQPPAFEWEMDSLQICYNTTEVLSAETPGATYLWSDGTTNSEITVSAAGIYSVEVSLSGCTVSDNIVVEVIPQETITLISSETCISENGLILISDINLHDDLIWSTGEIASFISVEEAGLYTATLESTCDTTLVSFYLPECPELHFYLPNTITPNGDGINDVLMPGLFINFPYDKYEFFIVNRFGEPVFQTNDITEVWDGGHLGSRTYVHDDVYVWRMKLSYGGNFIEETGSILILR